MKPFVSLVATLGGQPQIVTFTLDLLLGRGDPVDQVVAVYPASNPRYFQAYQRLAQEFASDHYAGRACHLRGVPVRAGELATADAYQPQEVEAVHHTFYTLLSDLKAQGQHLHLSLSGGRRILALVALEAAMQYLAPTDRVWHLHTPEAFDQQARREGLMHAPPEAGVQLVAVPFVPWAAYFPALAPLLTRTPQAQREAELGWLDEADRARCQRVWEGLTPRQKDVLRVLAQGMSRSQAAIHLGRKVSTIDSHRDVVFQHCQAAWGDLPANELDMRFLQRRFGPFLKGLGEI